MKEIMIREPKRQARPRIYIIDTALQDLQLYCRNNYYYSPENRGKEIAFSLKGIATSEARIITGIAHGEIRNSFSSVENPTDTLDVLDQKIRESGQAIVAGGHTHPFQNGHKFYSWTDRESMRKFGSLDPGQVFFIANPVTSEIAAYRWNSEKRDVENVEYTVVDSTPVSANPQSRTANEPDVQIAAVSMLAEESPARDHVLFNATFAFLSSALLIFGVQYKFGAASAFLILAGLSGVFSTALYFRRVVANWAAT
jgi:hypothetical protein